MHISWLGNSAIKIQTRPFDNDIVIIIDPYKPATGDFPRNLAPDIGLYTHSEENSITLSDNAFILSTPGEVENKGVLITAVQGHGPNEIMFRLDSEQLSVAHLGMSKKVLTDEQLGLLSGVDILILPVGGNDCYDAETASKVISEIEPRIIIPMAFKSDNDQKAEPISVFLKEMGTPMGEPEKKIIIKKKDLPTEETKVIILSKE